MTSLIFEPLSTATVPTVETWFRDPETRRRLGERGWVSRLLGLTNGGYDYAVLARHAWTVADDNALVGLVDVEVAHDQRAWLALVVRADRRGTGLGREILRGLEALPALAAVGELCGTAEPDNVAAQRCMRGAGFEDTGALDRDGFRVFRRPLTVHE